MPIVLTAHDTKHRGPNFYKVAFRDDKNNIVGYGNSSVDRRSAIKAFKSYYQSALMICQGSNAPELQILDLELVGLA